MYSHPLLPMLAIPLLVGGIALGQRIPALRRLAQRGGGWVGPLAPWLFAISTYLAGAILLFSGATPARAGRLGWINNVLPLPIVEASAYFASIAGVGLILLARGLQRRLDAAYHLTVWLLAGGIIFALGSALDVEQGVVLSLMLVVLVPSKRYFYRKASIFEERFTTGWIVAIVVVLVGTVALMVSAYGKRGLGSHVFWRFADQAQGPRAERALVLATIALMAFAMARLIRPARARARRPTVAELEAATPVVNDSIRASARMVFLADKSIMFNESRTAFIMYAIAGQSWVSFGDPVGSVPDSVHLIDEFIHRCDHAGGWPVFHRVPPALLYLYLDYALAAVKLGEVARVSLANFSLDGPMRRNLRRVWRKAKDEECTFDIVPAEDVAAVLPALRPISDAWLRLKRTREKGFSLGRFDEQFIMRSSTVGVVRQHGRYVAFVTLWRSGHRGEVEVDLMRYSQDAPSGIMRFALIEAMFWARQEGFAMFNLGMAPLSGIRASRVGPLWNQVSLAVRGVGERYYNFQGLRNFKDWFYPEWEPSYLVSPGGHRRPLILANISSLVSGGVAGIFRK